ncbi:MAG: chalcone isomerase family protein [Syntrophobacteraceae bacterium]
MISKKACVVLLSLVILTAPAFAATIAGLQFPDKINLAGQELVLNGGGKRTDYGIGVYVAGLYLKQKSADAASIVAADQPMDVKMQITSFMVTPMNMKDGFEDSFKKSATGDTASIQSKIDSFGSSFKGLQNHDIYDFAYVPGKGVEVSRNGKLVNTIAGMDFKKALFGIWLGPKPVLSSLKEGMLGK